MWAFAIVIAVNQLGIATTLINTLFMATVGAVALAPGLAFGLGGRETAGKIVAGWYGRDSRRRRSWPRPPRLLVLQAGAWSDGNPRPGRTAVQSDDPSDAQRRPSA